SNGAITFVPDNAASHTVRSSGPDGTVLTIAANAVINGGSPSLTSTISSTGAGVQAILNLGTITADANSGIVINADAFTNQGTVRAASGSTLRIAAANWTSENGSLGADGGTLDIGGTVTSAGLGLPTFFRNGGTVNLIGTVTNTAATMTLNAQTGTFTLNGGVITGGTLTLTGGAQLLFANNGSNRLDGPITVNGNLDRSGSAGYLGITGGSSTGAGVQAILNLGTITADANSGIVINADQFTNEGTVRAASGSTLRIDLPGSGTTWTNDGTIAVAPGSKVEIIDNLTLSATSLVSISVQGAGAANHGVLTSTGATTISGGFTAAYVNGYVPAEGTFFDVLTATGGRTGQFTSTALPTAPPTDKTVLIYEGTRVRMLSTDLADLNLDGVTNSLDFVQFLNWFTSLDPRADTNGDGNVNSLDFILYLNWFTDG
ncbi:MAG: hypothetical protein DPW19_05475, partial [cyanobacterium CYA1]|nr:hypothetical protein [cyanobacterium CYA1]